MDIDAPPAPDLQGLPNTGGHRHLDLPLFSASFPLPFRVLFLVGLAILLWATNLHILHALGLDTSWILDMRTDEDGLALEDLGEGAAPAVSGSERERTWAESGKLYGPVYKLFLVYTGYVGAGWLLFRGITGGDTESMESWRGLVGLIVLGAAAGAVLPWRGVAQKERTAVRKSIKRILLPSLSDPVFFADVILADILTSFAKVLGDLWVSSCQIWNGGITQGRVAQTGWSNYVTLFMVCFPYLIRFRQCLIEYYQNPAIRPLANSLKYFSAFPVILLSAAQKSLFYEIAAARGIDITELGDDSERWFGEYKVFRLWLFAVVVNSMYSIWWDIEMDWGLSLCEPDTWLGPKRDRRGLGLGAAIWGRAKQVMNNTSRIAHQRSPCPTPMPHFDQEPPNPTTLSLDALTSRPPWTAFGLRQILLLPDPVVYHLFALIDLVLRFTWSLKLSSHLHTISEIESGVFMMEALELMRRWMWVFVRIEWEAVKKGEAARLAAARGQVVWEGDKEADAATGK